MKVFLDSVGCRLNQAEIDKIARQFQAEGHFIVNTSAEADVIVINTCTVTSAAAADSRQKVRANGKQNKNNIFLTGCWSQIQSSEAFRLPNVAGVIENSNKEKLVQEVISWNENHHFISMELVDIGKQNSISTDPEKSEIKQFQGSGKKTRSFIKVQDGCNNSCTFCITTIARGKSVSIPSEKIIDEIQQTISGGSNEIVLTGVNLGSWGREFHQNFSELIKLILKYTDVKRLRLSSLEPWDLGNDFFSLWNDERLCQHLHMPLQSGSFATLKRMRRKTSPLLFGNLVRAAREIVPDIAITTDLIVGFPGEDEDEFNQSMQFVKEMNFAGGHVFRYSPRQGTPAAAYENHVDKIKKKERSIIAQNILHDSSVFYRQRFIGSQLQVLWEAASVPVGDKWQLEGLTGNYIKVNSISPTRSWNSISNVKLTQLTEQGMSGLIL